MSPVYQTISDFMQALFGVYTPVGYEDATGNYIIASGFAGVDWTYLCGVLLFCLVVYSLFRLVGGLLWKN